MVEPSKLGGSSADHSKFGTPDLCSCRIQKSFVNWFAFMVVKKLSSMLDSLSSRREGPGGRAGACSKGVSIGERKESAIRLERQEYKAMHQTTYIQREQAEGMYARSELQSHAHSLRRVVQYGKGIRDISVGREWVATLMSRVARTKAILSCLGLQCKWYAIRPIKFWLHKRRTRGVTQGHGGSPR